MPYLRVHPSASYKCTKRKPIFPQPPLPFFQISFILSHSPTPSRLLPDSFPTLSDSISDPLLNLSVSLRLSPDFIPDSFPSLSRLSPTLTGLSPTLSDSHRTLSDSLRLSPTLTGLFPDIPHPPGPKAFIPIILSVQTYALVLLFSVQIPLVVDQIHLFVMYLYKFSSSCHSFSVQIVLEN